MVFLIENINSLYFVNYNSLTHFLCTFIALKYVMYIKMFNYCFFIVLDMHAECIRERRCNSYHARKY